MQACHWEKAGMFKVIVYYCATTQYLFTVNNIENLHEYKRSVLFFFAL